MDDRHRHHRASGLDPDLRDLLSRAYATSVDVDTAARHLWTFHRTSARLRRRRWQQTLVAACMSVLMLSTSGVAVAASGSALPGDALYHVKRGTERVHLLMSRAPESDARLHLQFARTRLSEALAVAPQRPATLPRLLGEAASSVERAEQVGGAALVQEVNAVREEASEALLALTPALDGEVLVAIEGAAQRLRSTSVAMDVSEPPAQDEADETPRRSRADGDERERSRVSVRTPALPPAPTGETSATPAPTPRPPESARATPSPSPSPAPATSGSGGQETTTTSDEPSRGEQRASAREDPADDGKRKPEVRELGDMLRERGDPGESGDRSVDERPAGDPEPAGAKDTTHGERVSRLPVAPASGNAGEAAEDG